jgi:hypothetical protein
MTQPSPEYEAEETDSGDDMCGQIVTMQITKVPRKCRTIRGELCLPCLEAMLVTSNVSCLRDSNLDTCRRCLREELQCPTVSFMRHIRSEIMLMTLIFIDYGAV